jgi:hypothetical protein
VRKFTLVAGCPKIKNSFSDVTTKCRGLVDDIDFVPASFEQKNENTLIYLLENAYLCWLTLNQGSQTRGPQATCGLREGPMRPANIRKNEDFEGNIKSFCLFFQKKRFLTHNSEFLFPCGLQDLTLSLMRPASHFEFETPALNYQY